jgi:hypothetical protein
VPKIEQNTALEKISKYESDKDNSIYSEEVKKMSVKAEESASITNINE